MDDLSMKKVNADRLKAEGIIRDLLKSFGPDRICDAFGLMALIITFVAAIWIVYGIGLPTGAAELLRVVK